MPWVPWMESTFPSDVHNGMAASTTTTRASIQLYSLVDVDYKFLWVDLGAAGSSSDAQIFTHSNLRHKIEDSTIGFPESESLVGDGPKMNYFILGDDAFPPKFWLTKPCSRLSQERRVVGNAFGTLTSHFWIFQRPMQH